MARLFLFIFLMIIPVSFSANGGRAGVDNGAALSAERLYLETGLDGIVDYTAFLQAWEGYNRIPGIRKEILTLIDFTKPSTEERLYVIDVGNRKLLYATHVAHGRNSGENYATSFSNRPGSHQSSLGFYLTDDTYIGGNGYSLRLDGLEKGINDKARERAVVIHGATYANHSPGMARLGRSLGCPALPTALNREVIDVIKEGSVLFIYADNKEYLTQSTILKPGTGTAKIAMAR